MKSKRVNGVPRHITVLDSLADLTDEKRKTLAKRIEQLVSNQLNAFSGIGQYEEIDELAQYFYRKLMKSNWRRVR